MCLQCKNKQGTSLELPENQQRLKYRARSLASIASRHLFEGDDVLAVSALESLGELGPVIRQSKLDADDLKMPWLRLMQAANQCEGLRRRGQTTSSRSNGSSSGAATTTTFTRSSRSNGSSSNDGIDADQPSSTLDDKQKQEDETMSETTTTTTTTAATAGIISADDATTTTTLPCNLAYSVLAAMSTFPSDNDDKVYEALSNALVRRVIFVKGAVDMSGLPPSDRGEVAFIGRSNVGTFRFYLIIVLPSMYRLFAFCKFFVVIFSFPRPSGCNPEILLLLNFIGRSSFIDLGRYIFGLY